MELASPCLWGHQGSVHLTVDAREVALLDKFLGPAQRITNLNQGAQILKGIPIEGVSNSRHLLCHSEECNDEASGEGSLPSTPDSSPSAEGSE